MRVVTVGGATQDLYLLCHDLSYLTFLHKGSQASYVLFDEDEKLEIATLELHSGGGATNTAASFARLGAQVQCCALVGDDAAGAMVRRELEQYRIDTKLLQTTTQHSTAQTFVACAPHPGQVILVYRAANRFFVPPPNFEQHLKGIDVLYVTSLSHQASSHLARVCQDGKKAGAHVAVNPGSSQLAQGLFVLRESLPHIDTLIMNDSEATTFMYALSSESEHYRKVLHDEREIVPACQQDRLLREPYLLHRPIVYQECCFDIRKFFAHVLALGPSTVVVTNGANGVYIAQKEQIWFVPSAPATIVSAIGAGDAFASCFVYGLCSGMDIAAAAVHGVLNSASVLGARGAKPGLLTQEQVKALATQTLLPVQQFALSLTL